MSTTNYTDPHKHPLYHPHMGDMTGWRFLEVGETCGPNDEWRAIESREDYWSDVCSRRYEVEHDDLVCYRRRVTPEDAKPTDQKRFVTVVFETEQGQTTDALLDGPDYCGMKFSQIREGNALAELDRIEDNVIEAVKNAVRKGNAQ